MDAAFQQAQDFCVLAKDEGFEKPPGTANLQFKKRKSSQKLDQFQVSVLMMP